MPTASMDSLRVSSVILISLMPVDQGPKDKAAWVQFPALLLIAPVSSSAKMWVLILVCQVIVASHNTCAVNSN